MRDGITLHLRGFSDGTRSHALIAIRAVATRSSAGQRAFRALQNMAQALIKLGHYELALVHAQAAAHMHTTAVMQDHAWAAWLRSALCCKELQLWAAGQHCIQHVRRARVVTMCCVGAAAGGGAALRRALALLSCSAALVRPLVRPLARTRETRRRATIATITSHTESPGFCSMNMCTYMYAYGPSSAQRLARALQIQAQRNTPELNEICSACMEGMGVFHPLLLKGMQSSESGYIDNAQTAYELLLYCRSRELVPFQVALLEEVLAHNHAETVAPGAWRCTRERASEAAQEAAMATAKERFGAGDYRGALRVWRWALHQGQIAAEAPHRASCDGAGDATLLRDVWLSLEDQSTRGVRVQLTCSLQAMRAASHMGSSATRCRGARATSCFPLFPLLAQSRDVTSLMPGRTAKAVKSCRR